MLSCKAIPSSAAAPMIVSIGCGRVIRTRAVASINPTDVLLIGHFVVVGPRVFASVLSAKVILSVAVHCVQRPFELEPGLLGPQIE